MCLYAKVNKVLIADKDFYVYKNFFAGNIEETLSSPYQNTVWKLGETKTTAFFAKDDYPQIKFKTRLPKYVYMIGRGFHSWVTKKQAMTKFGEVTVRCTIPKGTPYIIGTRGDIVSLSIKLDAVVRGKRHLRWS